MASSSESFITPSAGKRPSHHLTHVRNTISLAPTGVPRDVSASSSSRSILVTWETIDCIEHNGVIIAYLVMFQGVETRAVIDRNFTASGLTPNTSYTFQVAGVNANGTGPYTELITINTKETDEEHSTFTSSGTTTMDNLTGEWNSACTQASYN